MNEEGSLSGLALELNFCTVSEFECYRVSLQTTDDSGVAAGCGAPHDGPGSEADVGVNLTKTLSISVRLVFIQF